MITACQKNKSTEQPAAAQTLLNVSFGSHSQQKMDVYLPAGRNTATTKVMILIHGGGWNTGDKTDFNPFIDSLRKREPDFAIFNINYHLSDGTSYRFPAQENDVKAALEFIISKKEEYEISDKIVLVGASAIVQ